MYSWGACADAVVDNSPTSKAQSVWRTSLKMRSETILSFIFVLPICFYSLSGSSAQRFLRSLRKPAREAYIDERSRRRAGDPAPAALSSTGSSTIERPRLHLTIDRRQAI